MSKVIISQTLTPQGVVRRLDTLYEQRIIDGEAITVRRIIMYDSILEIPKLKSRKCLIDLPFDLQDSDSLNFHEPTNTKVALNNKLLQYGTEIGFSSTFWNNSLEAQSSIIGFGDYQIENDNKPLITNGLYFNSFFYWGNLYFRTGTSLQIGKQNTFINYTITNVDSTTVLDPIQYDIFIIDTLHLLDITQLPDTNYITLIDTFKKTIKDTFFHTTYDTTKIDSRYKLTNRYFYVEIPLITGYEFDIGHTKLSFDGGLFINVLIRERLWLNVKKEVVKHKRDKYSLTINMDIGGRLSWQVPIFDVCYLRFSAGFRYGMLNLYNNHNFILEKKLNFSFAIGYYFN